MYKLAPKYYSQSTDRSNSVFWVGQLSCLLFLFGLNSCEPKNEPPIAKLEVSPLSGEIPIEVRLKVSGQDPDGVEDIKQYVLYIGTETVKSNTPIDVKRTFDTPGTVEIYGEVVDSEDQSNKTVTSSLILTLTEGLEQSAALINDNEISYSATLKKIGSAELTVNKDGNMFLKQSIADISLTGSDFQKVFKYNPDGLTKGTYEFILKAGDLERKTMVVILNYKPTLNLDGVSTDFEEDTENILDLNGKMSDMNPEDNPVSINSTLSLNERTNTTLDGNSLKIKSFWDKLGEYKVKLILQNAGGELEELFLNGNVIKGHYEYIVNPFISSNSNGAAYDLLTTKAQRDAYVQQKLFEDWTNTIMPSFAPNPIWVCMQYANQLMVNFHGIPGETGYSGFDLDSIYWYSGTLKENGKYGLPVYWVLYNGTFSHAMNCILTGEDATKFEDWCFIEPQRDSINVKPDHLYMEENCTLEIRAFCLMRDGVVVGSMPILVFVVKDGVGNLGWINNETCLANDFGPAGNPSVKIITER